jgi:hypothetical protein
MSQTLRLSYSHEGKPVVVVFHLALFYKDHGSASGLLLLSRAEDVSTCRR